MQTLGPSRLPVPDFTPVPRQHRYDGWTERRQRAFIAALAELGSVQAAARRINMSSEGAYYLRRQPGAESFAAAWASALDHGVQSLADIAIDRAREGVPVPVFWQGDQVGERRQYDNRLLMFILRHHQPERYGPLPMLREGTKAADTLAREARGGEMASAERIRIIEQLLERYEIKVLEERQYRLEGHVVHADFTLRQLTHIELALDIGGETAAMIKHATGFDPSGQQLSPELHASKVSEVLASIRAQAWEKLEDPPRPTIRLNRHGGTVGESYTSPTRKQREAIQRAAQDRIAEAQAEWEAAATEEGWTAWCAGRE
jgi:hypothetical protein